MNVRTKKAGFTLMGVLLALCLCLALIPYGYGGAKAYDGLPNEFGSVVGAPIVKNAKTYVNYEGGYLVYDGDVSGSVPAPTAAEKHVGGKNVNADGAVITDPDIRDFILGKGNFTIADGDLDGVRLVYGAGWTDTTKEDVIAKFKAKFAELYDAETPYVCGVPCSTIGPWDTNEIKMDFRYGDGSAAPEDGSGGKKNATILVYNVLDDEVRLVNADKINQKYSSEQRRLGAPLTETGTYSVYGKDGEGTIDLAKDSAMSVTAQIYETGIIYLKEDGSAQKLEGMPFDEGAGLWRISPVVKDQDVRRKKGDGSGYEFIGNVDGTWHPLKNARNTVYEDGTFSGYYNFTAGCIEVVYNADETQKSAMRYAGYNFVKGADGYEKKILPVQNYTAKDELLFEGGNTNDRVSGDALTFYKNSHADAAKEDVIAAFRKGYLALAAEEFVPGYRCSNAKMWDLLVVDYKYGDGTTGFDSTGSGGRERMTTLVYSPVRDAVYGVHSEYFDIFKQDSGIGRKVTGAPMSNVLKNHTFDGKTFEEIQFYEQGYLYKEKGEVKSVIGITAFDDDYAVKTIIPAPELPGDYGAKIGSVKSEDGRVTYINYRYGAVKATQNKANTACVYDYYNGRNFEFDKGSEDRAYLEVYLLPISDFIGADGEKITQKDANAAYKKHFEDVIRPLIVAEYTKYYNAGFFLGFPEGKFGDWNGCDGMQFRWGDSTARPFNDGRDHIALLAYNKTSGNFEAMKDVKEELYLVKDAILDAWASKWIAEDSLVNILGIPVSNPYQIEGCDDWFQDFKNGDSINLIVQGTSMGISYYTDGTTAQDYADAQKQTFPDYPDGDKIPDTDVTEKEEYEEQEQIEVPVGCGSIVNGGGAAAALAGGVLALGALVVIGARKKKKEN